MTKCLLKQDKLFVEKRQTAVLTSGTYFVRDLFFNQTEGLSSKMAVILVYIFPSAHLYK